MKKLVTSIKSVVKNIFKTLTHTKNKRGRNLLLSEMKSVKVKYNSNYSERGRNLLINAYRKVNLK